MSNSYACPDSVPPPSASSALSPGPSHSSGGQDDGISSVAYEDVTPASSQGGAALPPAAAASAALKHSLDGDLRFLATLLAKDGTRAAAARQLSHRITAGITCVTEEFYASSLAGGQHLPTRSQLRQPPSLALRSLTPCSRPSRWWSRQNTGRCSRPSARQCHW